MPRPKKAKIQPVVKKITISDELWVRSQREGKVKLELEDRKEVLEQINWFVAFARFERTWPPDAERIPVKRLQRAAENFLAALDDLDQPSDQVQNCIRNSQSVNPSDVKELATRATRPANNTFRINQHSLLWQRAPDTDGGFTDDEFGVRLDFDRWRKLLARDVNLVRDVSIESLANMKGRPAPRPNSPLMGLVNRLLRVYREAGGTPAAYLDTTSQQWSPFVRWMWCFLEEVPDSVPTRFRKQSISAFGHWTQDHLLLIRAQAPTKLQRN